MLLTEGEKEVTIVLCLFNDTLVFATTGNYGKLNIYYNLPTNSIAIKDKLHTYSFSIVSGSKDFLLTALSEEEKEDTVDAIQVFFYFNR